ncbi:MAG: nicotinate (nicotinamide) nucleotide adenylyltransferase [Bacteroidales bacterium]|nr:nicotinate (nicotinamide) nucleotide adenylyltransferase [Bacteroidales bacterium]MCM1146916.1 nicotinate (nicotinamide) nucleotide adenylyltransferase [Bacteroidales bacterium]MCM1205586.1 nicotinate (nicotinamide) nucleotide adenylyltransferase [Bacillota bacterium]MCM1510303.1 nicotinate (nicotinamide) nucleotide adenylyltransferase [Clostridium sp.]
MHLAHTALAKAFRRQLGLDEVWFLVTPQNPWKAGSTLSPDRDRFNMAVLALEDEEGLTASDYEFRLEKPSFSYRTLRHLRKEFPDTEFTILIGGDNWTAFDKWAEYREILNFHPVAVYPRKDSRLTAPESLAGNDFRLTVVQSPLMDISSTEIRRRVFSGEEFDNLVCPKVAEYIIRNGLYSKRAIPQRPSE